MKIKLENSVSFLVLILISTSFLTCLGPKVDELNFYGVSMSDPMSTVSEPGTVTLTGSVDDNAVGDLVDQGFLLSEIKAEVDNNTAEKLSATLVAGIFTNIQAGLDLEKVYYLKSFAVFEDDRVDGERMVYSETTWPFSFDIFLGTNENSTIKNDQAEVCGFISGLQSLGVSANSHGFIYSSEPTASLVLSEIETGISDTVNLGLINDDSIFYAVLKDLDFNSNYQVRTWAETNTETYYSDQIQTFETKDGWKLLSDSGFELCKGVGETYNGKYYLMGCTSCGALDGCMMGSGQQPLYRFDPMTDPGQGLWSNSGSNLNNLRFTDGISFRIMDTIYFGTGMNEFPLRTIYKINISDIGTANFEEVIIPPPLDVEIPLRSQAVAFVVNGNAYIGTGRDAGSEELQDFWEYKPTTGSWRQVASLPQQTAGSSPEDNGRRNAMSFVINGVAYVGGGQFGASLLKDFWMFNPPLNTNDMGSWEFVEFFEGAGRIDGVRFVLDDKGYFGTGVGLISSGEPTLNDFWVFDPGGTTVFEERTCIPGNGRFQSVGFAMEDRGYIGLGSELVLNQSMLLVRETLYDSWIYTPRPN